MIRDLASHTEVPVIPSPNGFHSPEARSERTAEFIAPSLISADDLYRGEIKILRPVFENLLWDGLTMLIAKPKAGKSWFTLQLSIHAAGGQVIEGLTAVDLGTVLYAALEEPQARTMTRLRQLAPHGDWARRLHFVYELLPLMGGGVEQLAALCEKLKPRLVVLDTFTALVKSSTSKGDVFRSQYSEVSQLRKLAEQFRTAIVVVHHQRKGLSDGAIEAVAGTGGIAAAVDTLWHLKSKPEGEAELNIIGRETEERTLTLQFDKQPIGWRVLGDTDSQVLNADRRQVIDLLREEGALTPAQISAEIGKARSATRMLLKRMRGDLLVRKQGNKYIAGNCPTSMSDRVTDRERESVSE